MQKYHMMSREELLTLPTSITNWIILRNYVAANADVDIYKKLIHDYWFDCPLFEMEILLENAKKTLNANEIRDVINYLFELYHSGRD